MSMMLDIIEAENPALIRAACDLHQRGEIPPDCYVVDLDVVRENARRVVECARSRDLRIYAMTKQINRNPSMVSAIAEAGVDGFVAVDIEGARQLHSQGQRVSHVGHLSQIPRYWIPEVLAMKPEVWTVHCYETAAHVSEVAAREGIVQDLLLKVIGPRDFAYTSQEGGITTEELIPVARKIAELPGVRMVGVTGFPTIVYNMLTHRLEALPNISTIGEAARQVSDDLGIEMAQINCPGNSSCSSMDLIAEHGGTDAEPGAAFWGMAPQQLFAGDAGTPAQVYLAEISHRGRDRVLVLGGGFYADGLDGPWALTEAFVGGAGSEAITNRVRAEIPDAQWIDYYAWLYPESGQRAAPGDSAIYFFRPQVFKTRSAHVATLEGVGQGSPRVVSVYDRANRRLR